MARCLVTNEGIQVAVGKLPELTVFGNDYDTKDGTGVRDFIHVQDLAAGHVAAVKKLQSLQGEVVVNLGTGAPHESYAKDSSQASAAGCA